MNAVVVLVVTDATQPDLEAALLAGISSLKIYEIATVGQPELVQSSDSDKLPFWTWFLPNPCR